MYHEWIRGMWYTHTHTHEGILFIHEKEENFSICENTGHKHQTALLASLSKKESNGSLAEQKETAKRQRWGERKLIR